MWWVFLKKNPPQELHAYLSVWYYVIVGEGEKLPQRKRQPNDLPPSERKPRIMRTIDFSAVKPGDIILVVDPSILENDPRHVLEYCTSKNVVTTTNGVDSLVMANVDYVPSVLPMLITKTSEGFMCEPLNGASEPKLLPTECLYHFTLEEYKSARIDERISAQSQLARSMRFWYGTEAPFPKSVAKAVEQALEEKVDKHMSNANVVNVESAYKTMGEVVEVTEKVYREAIAENMGVMDELIQRANDAHAEVTGIAQSLNPWRNDGEAVTVTRQHGGNFDYRTTFRTGTGIMTDSGDAYFIYRVTKSQAYVTNPATGEAVGYLTRTKANGVVLKFENGATKTLGVNYDIIPTSTPEDLLAYKAASAKAKSILTDLYQHINKKCPELEIFSMTRASLPTCRNLADAQITAFNTVSELESKKRRTLEGMEANIAKMKRLYQQAYGN